MEYSKNISNRARVLDCKKLNEGSADYVATVKIEYVYADILVPNDVRVGSFLEVNSEEILNVWTENWGGVSQIFLMLNEHGDFKSKTLFEYCDKKDTISIPHLRWCFRFNDNVPEFYKILIKPFLYELGHFVEIEIIDGKISHSLKKDMVEANLDAFYDFSAAHERLRWVIYKGNEVVTGYKLTQGRRKGLPAAIKAKAERTNNVRFAIEEWVLKNSSESQCRNNRSEVARQIEEKAKNLATSNRSQDEKKSDPLFQLLKRDGGSLGFQMIYKYLKDIYPKNRTLK